MKPGVLDDFTAGCGREDLAPGALALARIEYPTLDAARYLALLDEMGDEVRRRLERLNRAGRLTPLSRVALVNEFLFGERGLAGNRLAYDDPRNSCLNEVLDRGLGIPISLGVVYIEVARRAGFRVEGVNFPGHFLLTCSGDDDAPDLGDPIVLDPFGNGAVLDEQDCRDLLESLAGEEIAFDRSLLSPAPPRAILTRMLVNLKRAYVSMRSFPQARDAVDLLLVLEPGAALELRDRGLLAYQLRDFSAALRDLQAYLRVAADPETEEESAEREQIREHVTALRKRVAELN